MNGELERISKDAVVVHRSLSGHFPGVAERNYEGP
jgi:hypothetical protein